MSPHHGTLFQNSKLKTKGFFERNMKILWQIISKHKEFCLSTVATGCMPNSSFIMQPRPPPNPTLKMA